MLESDLLTPKECAQYRRCSLRKLDRERAERRGCPYVRIDGRIFYRRGDVNLFIDAHLCGGTAESISGYRLPNEENSFDTEQIPRATDIETQAALPRRRRRSLSAGPCPHSAPSNRANKQPSKE